MQEVVFAGGKFVTSDEVAEALLEYAAALANVNRAATIRVPAVVESGEAAHVTVLVGPASQLMSEDTSVVAGEPEGAEFVRQVRERVEQLQRTVIVADPSSSLDWDI